MKLSILRPLLAILALLLMQQLGVLHRYAHQQFSMPPVPLQERAKEVAVSEQAANQMTNADVGNLPAHDVSLCGLLDHLCTADGMLAAVLALPAVLLAPVGSVFLVREWLRTPLYAFQARGPPVYSFNR